jgi:hypothetical protein
MLQIIIISMYQGKSLKERKKMKNKAHHFLCRWDHISGWSSNGSRLTIYSLRLHISVIPKNRWWASIFVDLRSLLLMKMQMTKESIFLLNLHGKLQHQMQTEPFNEPWKRHQKIDFKKKGISWKNWLTCSFWCLTEFIRWKLKLDDNNRSVAYSAIFVFSGDGGSKVWSWILNS